MLVLQHIFAILFKEQITKSTYLQTFAHFHLTLHKNTTILNFVKSISQNPIERGKPLCLNKQKDQSTKNGFLLES